jgi:hypothetical protein
MILLYLGLGHVWLWNSKETNKKEKRKVKAE